MLRNFHLFTPKDKSLRDQKRADWPAFIYSKLKTIKSFEESFVLINISGNNESNIILLIESPLAGYVDMSIKSSISSAPAGKKEIGDRIMKVYNLASSGLIKPV